MKYAAVILAFAVGAFAVPQAASVTPAPSASATPALSPTISCVHACPAGDVTCQAACLGNARPNASQAIATNECAAKCDQGNGSPEASIAYAKCVDSCINSLFPSSQTAFGPGAAASNAAASGSNAATTGARPTGSASGATAGASATPTGAADINSARIAGAGLAGLLAIFAI
jgi:hypothetical protein